MKIRINISISETANNILNQQTNKSQYIEDLILNESAVPAAGGELVEKIEEIVTNLVGGYTQKLEKKIETLESTLKNKKTDQEAFVPKPPDPITGFPCCTKQKPCKHWSYNGVEVSWTNSITGETKYVG